MSARTSPTRFFGIDAVALLALIRKEFIQALRDRRMLFMLLGVPVVQVILFGYAANLEFAHAATAVVDDDRSEESRAFVTGLGAEGTFALRPLRTDEDALRSLRLAESQAAIIIPRRFGEKLRAGRSAEVQLLVDGTEPTRAVGAAAALSGYAQRAGARSLVAAGVARPGLIQLQPRLLYNPGLKSRLFMVPGTAASILLIITTVVTAMGLARERELGTMEQLLVTPLRPLTLMIGKTVPYAVFGLIDEVLILVVGNLLFDVPVRGSLLVIFLGTVAYLMATLSLGLLISTFARSQQQAITGGFFVLMPALLLSGFLTPIDAMPTWIRPVTYLIPVRYFIEIMRGALVRGAGLADLALPLCQLAALGTALLLLSARRFRRTIA